MWVVPPPITLSRDPKTHPIQSNPSIPPLLRIHLCIIENPTTPGEIMNGTTVGPAAGYQLMAVGPEKDMETCLKRLLLSVFSL